MPVRLFAASLCLCLALSSTASALGTAVQISAPLGVTVVGPVSVAGPGATEITTVSVGQDSDLALPVQDLSLGAGIGQLDASASLWISNQATASEARPAEQSASQENVQQMQLAVRDLSQPHAPQPVENSGASAPAASAKKAGADTAQFDETDFGAAAGKYLPHATQAGLVSIGKQSLTAAGGTEQQAAANAANIFAEDLGAGSAANTTPSASDGAVVTALAAAVPTVIVSPDLAPAPRAEAQAAEVAESAAGGGLGQAAAVSLDGVQSAPTPLILVQTDYPYSFEILETGFAASGAALAPLGTISVGLGLEAVGAAASAGFLPGFSGVPEFVPASSSRPSRRTARPAVRPIRTVAASAAPSGVSARHGVRALYRGLRLLRSTAGVSAPTNRIPVRHPGPVGRPLPMPINPSRPIGRP